jgi:glucose-6-phosphate isomerase
MDNFRQLLVGAHAMDRHFKSASLESNMPVMMALITVWYRGFFDCHSSAVVPYSQGLKLLPAYLQQLYMESLGKSVDVSGAAVSIGTGEVLWGGVGSDGQHSYFQLLHQGSDFIPVDFIAFATANLADAEAQHRALLANCFSQSLALMAGETDPESPHKNIAGNKPSNTLLLNALTPYNLGSLIALFEHKVYVQSVIWNINAFDQWGVELGKRLSRVVFDAFENAGEPSGLDDSTISLIKQVREWNC